MSFLTLQSSMKFRCSLIPFVVEHGPTLSLVFVRRKCTCVLKIPSWISFRGLLSIQATRSLSITMRDSPLLSFPRVSTATFLKFRREIVLSHSLATKSSRQRRRLKMRLVYNVQLPTDDYPQKCEASKHSISMIRSRG